MARYKKLNPAARFIRKPLSDIMRSTYDFPVTFIGAPEGYGKTVLTESLEDDGSTYRITIHSGDVSYLNDSLKDIFESLWPDFPESFYKIDNVKKCRIIIENLHLVENYRETAEKLCMTAAESSGRIHFVITSRINIWNDSSNEVVTGKVCLITPEMLLLNEEEIVQYFHACGIRIDRKKAEELHDKTDGWILPLYLTTAEYIRSRKLILTKDIRPFMRKYIESSSLEKNEIDFAGKLCIPDTFTLSQAERFTGVSETEKIIDKLMTENIFIIYEPVTGKYHFNCLFRNFMIKTYMKFEQNHMNELLKKAGGVFMEDGIFSDAADCYYHAGEYDSMMMAVKNAGCRDINRKLNDKYKMYYHECPPEVRRHHHAAVLYMAFQFFNFGAMKLYREASMDFLEDLYADRKLSEKDRGVLLCNYSMFHAMTDLNDLDKVKQHYDNAIAAFDGKKRTECGLIPQTFGVSSVLKLFYNKGSINDTLEKIDEIAERGRILMGNGWSGISYMAKAEAALITLDYNTAEIFINIAEREYKEPKVRNDGIMLCIAFFNAMLDLSFGKYRTVANEIDFFIDKEKVLESEALKKSAEVCDAWLKAHLGMTGNIADWMKTGDFSNMDLLYHAMPSVYLVHMYVLFSMKKYNKMLSYYELFFGSEPITNNLIVKESAYVLFACAWNEIGKSYNARQCLYEACCMARDTGNLISFVFYGETLIPLLKQVPDEFSELADKIIPQIERFVKNRDKCKKETAGSNMIGLTKREIQIAECAASGMTNREIADELEISENTVKTTLKRIFSKLEISSRRQLALKVKV